MKTKLDEVVRAQVASYLEEKNIAIAPELLAKIVVERTRDKSHGDFATNLALILAKPLKSNPKSIAQELLAYFNFDDIERVEIAGPGFINFHLTDVALQNVVKEILTRHRYYGTSSLGANKKVNIEFVSSNPTGPLHVGHGRHAAYGATLANLLETVGYKVHREYYINDAGRQMNILAVSVWLRYLALFGEEFVFPTNGYKGDYVIDIAKALKSNVRDSLCRPVSELFANLPADEKDNVIGGDKDAYIDALIKRAKKMLGQESFELVLQFGLKAILDDIKEDLSEFGVTYQQWFSEKSLEHNGDIEKGLNRLEAAGSIYKKLGATWFQATSYGDEKDRVVIRENGQATYFASDIGYHFNKYERGFDIIIDILGADHHGYAPRLNAFLKAAGEDTSKLKVLLVQFAVLYRGKQKASMSTRSGDFVTLRELREEVGNDAARFFYVMRKCDQHLDFDLELAKSKSNENPVYYIQYAYARICSVERQLKHHQMSFDINEGMGHSQELILPHEKQLLRYLTEYPEMIEAAALNYEPHIIVHYLQELATYFHTYYNACKFLVEQETLRKARVCLILAVKIVLANGLKILGVSTPEVM